MFLKITTLLTLFSFFALILSYRMIALDVLQREMFTLRPEIKIQHLLGDLAINREVEEAKIKKDLDANRKSNVTIQIQTNLVPVIKTDYALEEYDNLLRVLTKELMAIKIPFGSKKDIEIIKRLELLILVKFGYFINCFWSIPHPAFLQDPNYQCDQFELASVLISCFDVEVRTGELKELINETAIDQAFKETSPNYRVVLSCPMKY